MVSTLCDAQLLQATFGVPVESLRLYEARGLLRPLLVDGERLYTPRDRIRLEIIVKGKRLGFSLVEIEKLVFGAASQPGTLLADDCASSRSDLDHLMEELRTLTGQRGSLDVAIAELKALLAGK